MLDMGTENYAPNFEVANNNLEPLRIKVAVDLKNKELPFENDFFRFDNKQAEEFISSEVYRILKKGGIFFTQQVSGDNDNHFILHSS